VIALCGVIAGIGYGPELAGNGAFVAAARPAAAAGGRGA
jgi:hypothetical protein